MTDKWDLRRRAQSVRTGLQAPDLTAVLAPLLASAHRVASYVGLSGEPRVEPQLGWLLPVLRDDDDLDWTAYAGTLAPGRRGVLEPIGARLGVAAIAECDVILVPALLVDVHGYRLGKGGGSYDRALARATGVTVALLYDDEEVVAAVPHEEHDIPVRAYCTPTRGLVRLS